MEKIVISAPGKLILHGEHAVVYGKAAIAASLDLRGFLHLSRNKTEKVNVKLPDVQVEASWHVPEILSKLCLPIGCADQPGAPDAALLGLLAELAGTEPGSSSTRSLALVTFLYLYTILLYKDGTLPGVDVTMMSSLPPGAGLGSSAGFAVSLTAGLLRMGGHIPAPDKELEKQEDRFASWSDPKVVHLINSWAWQGEHIIHGRCSGIDNSVSTFGGALRFQNGEISNLERVPNFKILLINTKVPRSTKVMVAGVRERYNKYKSVIEPVFDSIENISAKCEEIFQEASDSLSEEQYQVLMELISMNQSLLATLGVSHPALDTVCQLLAGHGLPAKLTGAGGGGCLYALIPPGVSNSAINSVKDEVAKLGYDCWETSVGGYGVLQHFTLGSHFNVPSSFSC